MRSSGVQRVGKLLILTTMFVVPALSAEKPVATDEKPVTADETTVAVDEKAVVADERVVTAGPVAPEEVSTAVEAPDTQTPATATKTKDPKPAAASSDKKLYVDIYPIFGWIPFFSANITVPPLPGGGGGQSLGGSTAVKLNGALAFALDVRYNKWLFEGEGMFASVGAQRQTPYVDASTRLNYWDGFIGYDAWKGVYAIAGVRRISVDFKATVLNSPTFARKPVLTDPLVGVEWRKQLPHKFNVQARFDIGGFGVGSYVDIDAQFRAEWRFTKHFGALLGYQLLYDELRGTVSDTVLNQTVTRNWKYAQTFHGPVLGIGIYF